MNQHIQNIEISNFKSIKDLKIDGCRKINIFAGKPNAGKSNILEALGTVKVENLNDINLNEFLRIDNYRDLFYNGKIEDSILIKANDEFTELLLDQNGLKLNSGNSVMNFKSEIEVGDFYIDPMKQVYFATEAYDANERLNIIGYYFRTPTFSTKFRKSLDSFGDNLGEVLFYNSDIREQISKYFDTDYKMRIDKGSLKINLVKEIEKGIDFSLSYNMIADTLQRLIFYKAAIMSNHDSVLLFEEPEAHCFEPYILEFTNEVKFNENNNQFFMVTHSDFIIQEFLRDEESKNDLQIYLVNNVDGKTEVKNLDRDGNDDVYDYGMNVYFNFDSLWENN